MGAGVGGVNVSEGAMPGRPGPVETGVGGTAGSGARDARDGAAEDAGVARPGMLNVGAAEKDDDGGGMAPLENDGTAAAVDVMLNGGDGASLGPPGRAAPSGDGGNRGLEGVLRNESSVRRTSPNCEGPSSTASMLPFRIASGRPVSSPSLRADCAVASLLAVPTAPTLLRACEDGAGVEPILN